MPAQEYELSLQVLKNILQREQRTRVYILRRGRYTQQLPV